MPMPKKLTSEMTRIQQLEAKIVQLHEERKRVEMALVLAKVELAELKPEAVQDIRTPSGRTFLVVSSILKDAAVRNVYFFLCDRSPQRLPRSTFDHLIPSHLQRKWTRALDDYNRRNPEQRICFDEGPTSSRLYWARK